MKANDFLGFETIRSFCAYLKMAMVIVYSLLLLNGCERKIKPENQVLILAKRTSFYAGNGLNSTSYFWNGKRYNGFHRFDGRYSKDYDYFLIYIDIKNPTIWLPYSCENFGYSDTSFIADTLRRKLYIDNIDFILLEREH